MPDFVADIDAEIDYLLPTMEDLRSVDKVIFAGGSCYVRQILEFIMNKFDHLTRDQDFFFNEHENAIAKGALAYQKERNKGRNPISTRLSMSTYLQLDYDKHDIPDWLMTGSNFKFISHNGKNYIELASKGAPLTQENPRVNGFGSLFKNPKFIPVKKTQQETKTTWKIFQIRSSAHNGRDYEAITDKTEPIDEITFSLSTFENAINNFAPLRLIYAFDIYGDFYRNVRILTQRKSDLKNLHEKNPDLDWRNQDKVRDIRDTLFGSENRGNQ
jgi:hypothetical protein